MRCALSNDWRLRRQAGPLRRNRGARRVRAGKLAPHAARPLERAAAAPPHRAEWLTQPVSVAAGRSEHRALRAQAMLLAHCDDEL